MFYIDPPLRDWDEERRAAAALVLGTLAGEAAENVYSFGSPVGPLLLSLDEGESDAAHEYAAAVDQDDPDAVVGRACAALGGLMADPAVWAAVERLAQALLAEQELSGTDALDVLGRIGGVSWSDVCDADGVLTLVADGPPGLE